MLFIDQQLYLTLCACAPRVNEWVEVWDAALDTGVKGTRIA